MLSSKPLASLSSGLLARKGQAKPAMRPQGFGGFAAAAAPTALEDLGWNDMGAPEPAPPVPVPPVVTLREVLAERIDADTAAPHRDNEAAPSPEPAAPLPAARPVSLATAARISRDSAKQTRNGKAAFTLRLDAERHLKLRLASALGGRSAQVLVTEAVDTLLASMPEVAALLTQLPEPKRRR